MWYVIGIGGLLSVVIALAARFAGVPAFLAGAAATWLQGLGVGLLVGSLAHFMTAGGNGGRARAANGRTTGVFDAQGSTCPKCRRPLLPGVKSCPFCNPPLPESPLQATMHKDYAPLDELVPMPGLATAAQQTREAGARGYLHIFTGANKGQSLLLAKTIVSIGRGPENTLILKDDGVSHRHAEVRPEGNYYIVVDANSKNGTFVNDQRVGQQRKLMSGDVIAVGESKMLFQVS
jgi:hypothetical protein